MLNDIFDVCCNNYNFNSDKIMKSRTSNMSSMVVKMYDTGHKKHGTFFLMTLKEPLLSMNLNQKLKNGNLTLVHVNYTKTLMVLGLNICCFKLCSIKST